MNEVLSLNAEDSFRGLYLLVSSDIRLDILAYLYSFFSHKKLEVVESSEFTALFTLE